MLSAPAMAQQVAAPAPQTPVSPAAVAVQDSLSLSQALRLAYLNNPALNSARSDLQATQEELPQAQAGWKPIVTADADVTNSDSDSGGSDENNTSKSAGLTLTQPVYRGGRTVAETASARSAIAARSQILRAQEQDIFENAVIAYMDVLRDEALLDLQRQNSDLQSRQLKATSDRFEVGELTKTDVSQSEARVAEAEANVIDAQGNLNSSRAVFEQVIGVPAGHLAPPDIRPDVPDTLADVTRQAEEASPLVLAAVNTHNASEKDIETVLGELLPQVGFFASAGRTYDPPSGGDDRNDRSVGLEASIPLYEAGAVRSRARQAKHNANSRYLDILDTKRQVREAAVRNWEDLQAARAQIMSRSAQVEASRIAQEGVRQEAEFGARSVLDALDADQELLDAQVALVVARRDEVAAQFSLLATLGLLTPEVLGFGGEAINIDSRLQEKERKFLDMGVDRVGQPG
ncbi:MAG: TolC family outer membrane protein [Alphaproteobacteria bacterium]